MQKSICDLGSLPEVHRRLVGSYRTLAPACSAPPRTCLQAGMDEPSTKWFTGSTAGEAHDGFKRKASKPFLHHPGQTSSRAIAPAPGSSWVAAPSVPSPTLPGPALCLLSFLASLYSCFCFLSTARFLGHPCLCASYIMPMCPEERKIPSNPAAL